MSPTEGMARLNRIAALIPSNIERSVQRFSDSDIGPHFLIGDIVASTMSSLVPGKRDRIWTGKMASTGRGRVSRQDDVIFFDFGWLDEDAPDYIAIQEHGGEAPPFEKYPAKEVTPMGALEQISRLYIDEWLLTTEVINAVQAALAQKKV